MRVLIGCEYSGTVRRAFEALGHDAWSCDLLPTKLSDQMASPTVELAASQAAHFDNYSVEQLAYAMRIKLAVKRQEGRGGWQDKEQCSGEYLSQLLREHVEKGDPVDVANFCMMLHQRGERIGPSPQPKKPLRISDAENAEAGARSVTEADALREKRSLQLIWGQQKKNSSRSSQTKTSRPEPPRKSSSQTHSLTT